MNDLARYLELIVEPTFDEFKRNPTSVRHAFLACVATYHAIDRITFPQKPSNLRKEWGRKSLEFKLIDIVVHHFKHVKSNDEKITPSSGMIPLAYVLGFSKTGEEMELRNLFFVIQDAIKFLDQQTTNRAR